MVTIIIMMMLVTTRVPFWHAREDSDTQYEEYGNEEGNIAHSGYFEISKFGSEEGLLEIWYEK